MYLIFLDYHSNITPINEKGQREDIVVCNYNWDAAKPYCIHESWAPYFVPSRTQAELGCLKGTGENIYTDNYILWPDHVAEMELKSDFVTLCVTMSNHT